MLLPLLLDSLPWAGWRLALERWNTRLKLFMGLELGEMLLSLPFTLDNSNLNKLGRLVLGLREGGPTLLELFLLDRQLATLDRWNCPFN